MAAQEDAVKPILVELFTSEGCSSCPAADRFLTELQESQPIAGVVIIPLGVHVDYWDHLGWKDPFSAPEFSDRQRELARIWGDEQIYTPQLVINGKTGLVGSRRQEVLAALQQAADYRPLQVQFEALPAGKKGSVIELQIRVEGFAAADSDRGRYRLRLAVTEDNLQSKVARGENSGRHLKHVAVVRKLAPVGAFKTPVDFFQTTTRIELDPSWKRDDLSIVVFVEDLRSLEILGAAGRKVTW